MAKHAWAAFVLPIFATLVGCVLVDPKAVGAGQYLRLMSGDDVLVESGTSKAGLQNCANTAYELLRTNKALEGQVKCADAPTTQALPYSYRAHNKKTTAADHVLSSSPYLVRSRTRALCEANLARTKQLESTEIVENNCSGPVTPQTAVPARPATSGRYMRLTQHGDVSLLLILPNAMTCEQYLTGARERLNDQMAKAGASLDCTTYDGQDDMPFRAMLRDELMGYPVELATRTELLCLSFAASLAKEMVPSINRQRYSFTSQCSEAPRTSGRGVSPLIPSPSWGGKVAAAVRPNVVFPEASKIQGNPGAEFDVRLNADGSILSQAMTRSSGDPNWDAAALAGLRRTGRLPPDENGMIPSRVIIMLRPKM